LDLGQSHTNTRRSGAQAWGASCHTNGKHLLAEALEPVRNFLESAESLVIL
jgi:hypothetical protein